MKPLLPATPSYTPLCSPTPRRSPFHHPAAPAPVHSLRPGHASITMAPFRPRLTIGTTDINYGYPTPAQSPEPSNGEVTCWLLDTRTLWPGDNIISAKGAQEALSLITIAEQNAIKGKMFVQDARMSLASALLKRAYVSKMLNIPWKHVKFGRKDDAKHGKPIAVDLAGRPIGGIDFNVSHQGGLVTLIGYTADNNHCHTPSGMVYGLISPTTKNEVEVGADIVCVNERDDYRTIDTEGLDGWVDIYDFVFSPEERWSMKYDVDYVTLLDGTTLDRDEIGRHDRCISRNKNISLVRPDGKDVAFNSEQIIEAKLRRFYTYFCYKEAYIKLSGEALLAPWLKELEFANVRSPRPGTQARCSTHGTWGERVDDVEVSLYGKPVGDVKMQIQAFEENFMLSAAIQGEIKGLKIPNFQSIDLQNDVLAQAHLAKNQPEIPSLMKTGDDVRSTSLDRDWSTTMSPNRNPYRHSAEVPLCLM